MYNSKLTSSIIDDIYDIVYAYIESMKIQEEWPEESSDYEKDDAIILYEHEGEYLCKVEHLDKSLILNQGKVSLCRIATLLDNSVNYKEPDYEKIKDFVFAFLEPDIPIDVINSAERLTNEYGDEYTIEFHHKGSDGAFYYLCNFSRLCGGDVIRKNEDEISIYTNIEPFAHSYVPNEVFDFLYPNENQYTYIRYMGMYKDENIFYPCHEDAVLADGYVMPVNELVSYDEHKKKCRYITGEQANRVYCELYKHIDL